GLGFALVGVGAWVITCGYMGVDPIQTLIKIVQNPSQAASILKSGASPLGTGTTTNGTSSSIGNAVVSFAAAQIGKPYVFGGEGDAAHDGGWDCSGLAQKAWASVGVKMPRGSLAQMAIGQKISKKSDLQPGDLVFP